MSAPPQLQNDSIIIGENERSIVHELLEWIGGKEGRALEISNVGARGLRINLREKEYCVAQWINVSPCDPAVLRWAIRIAVEKQKRAALGLG